MLDDTWWYIFYLINFSINIYVNSNGISILYTIDISTTTCVPTALAWTLMGCEHRLLDDRPLPMNCESSPSSPAVWSITLSTLSVKHHTERAQSLLFHHAQVSLLNAAAIHSFNTHAHTHTHTHTHTQRERDTHTHTHGQTDTDTHKERHTHTHGETNRHTQRDKHTDTHTHTHVLCSNTRTIRTRTT